MKTYAERDAVRTPIEWDGHSTVMLGTLSGTMLIRRMDGVRCFPRGYRTPDPKRLKTFALTGKWEYPLTET